MALRDDPETRAAYPFAFALTVEYRVTDTALSAAFTVHNPGVVVMPYAIGFHPGFNWPFAGGEKHGHSILFEKAEAPTVPRVGDGGVFLSTRQPVPMEGRRLPLVDGLIAGTPLCFFDANSHSVRFENGVGGAIVVDAGDFPHFALWAKAGAPYLSIETWTGYADPEGFAGELSDKPSMRFLEPGGTAQYAAELRYEAAARP